MCYEWLGGEKRPLVVDLSLNFRKAVVTEVQGGLVRPEPDWFIL